MQVVRAQQDDRMGTQRTIEAEPEFSLLKSSQICSRKMILHDTTLAQDRTPTYRHRKNNSRTQNGTTTRILVDTPLQLRRTTHSGSASPTRTGTPATMYVARHHRHQTPPLIEDALTIAIAQVRSDDFEND